MPAIAVVRARLSTGSWMTAPPSAARARAWRPTARSPTPSTGVPPSPDLDLFFQKKACVAAGAGRRAVLLWEGNEKIWVAARLWMVWRTAPALASQRRRELRRRSSPSACAAGAHARPLNAFSRLGGAAAHRRVTIHRLWEPGRGRGDDARDAPARLGARTLRRDPHRSSPFDARSSLRDERLLRAFGGAAADPTERVATSLPRPPPSPVAATRTVRRPSTRARRFAARACSGHADSGRTI